MIYVYAAADAIERVEDLAGIQGEALLLMPFDAATIVVGEVDQCPALGAAALRAQDTLMRTLHDRARALLPMRFGTLAADQDAVRRLLEGRSDLLSRLKAVRDCEQMVLRVIGSAAPAVEPAAPAASGTDYLRARARLHQPVPVLETLARGAGQLARDVRIEPASQPGLLGTVYHLIERGHAGEYREKVDGLVRQQSGIRVLVSGPSPPYAFA